MSLRLDLSLRHGGIVSLHAPVTNIYLPGNQPHYQPIVVRLHGFFAGPLCANLSLPADWPKTARTVNLARVDGNKILSQLRPALTHQIILTFVVTSVLASLSAALITHTKNIWNKGTRNWSAYALTCTAHSLVSCLMLGSLVGYALNSVHALNPRTTRLSGNLFEAGEAINSFMVSDNKLSSNQTSLPHPDGSVRLLHLSDDHLNYQGFVIANQWAKDYKVNLILDTGDTTDNGTTAEVDYLVSQGIALFNLPYLYVRGNHDSLAVQQAIGRLPNVHVLDGQILSINGLRIYGRGDPLFSPGWQISDPSYLKPGLHFTPGKTMSEAEQACLATLAVPFIEHDLSQGKPPDIVAIHNSEQVTGVKRGSDCVGDSTITGRVPLVLAGHWHKQSTTTINDTLILHTGSVGASGVSAILDPTSNTPYSANLLTFAPVRGHMQLIQEDILSITHHGNQISQQTIDDRIPITEPWYDQFIPNSYPQVAIN